MSKYRSSYGGHAPGHLRDAFLEALENYYNTSSTKKEWWDFLEDPSVISFYNEKEQEWWKSISNEDKGKWLVGQLWNCTDVLPGMFYDLLELTGKPTYAVAVRSPSATMDW